jgi:hypothetical protein
MIDWLRDPPSQHLRLERGHLGLARDPVAAWRLLHARALRVCSAPSHLLLTGRIPA